MSSMARVVLAGNVDMARSVSAVRALALSVHNKGSGRVIVGGQAF